MGETYRGLTIRFGGDTTSLQQALRGATASIASTQSELRKLNTALKMDPTQVMAVNVKMELLKERAQSVYEKMNVLNEGIAELGRDAKNATQLAQSLENAGKEAAEASQKVGKLNDALAKVKEKIEKDAGFKVFFDDKGKTDEMLSKFASLNTKCSELAQHYRTLAAEQKAASNANELATQNARLQDMATEFVKVQAQARNLREEFIKLHGQSMFDETEATRFKQSMKDIDAAIEQVEQEGRRLYSALEIDPTSIDIARQKVQATKDQMELLGDKATELRNRIKAIESSGIDGLEMSAREARAEFVKCADAVADANREIGEQEAKLTTLKNRLTQLLADQKENTAEYSRTKTEIEQVEAELVQLRAKAKEAGEAFTTAQARTELTKLRTDLSETTAKMKSMETTSSGLKSAFMGMSSTFTTLGMALSMNLTPYLSMAVSESIDAAEEIDSAYRDMRKTVTGTEEDFEALKESAMDFANTHVTSADQILEIEAMGGQLGLAVDELETFATTVANLNVATNISDASEMAQQLGQLANIMGDLSSETMPQFGDALVRLGNNNAALESDILDVASRIGSMGSIMGFTSPQILAWSTAIAATGQNSEAAGTAISNSMSDIETAVSTGGEKLQAFADVAGTTAEDFAAKWKSSPSDAMAQFVKGLQRIEKEGGSADATLIELGITGVRQKQALLGLSQTVDTLDDALAMSQDAWDGVSDQWGEAGDAANEAGKKAEGFSGQLQMLRNKGQDLGAIFAESLAPVLKTVNAILEKFVDVMKDAPEPVKLTVIAIAALVAGIGPLATLIGPLITSYKTMNSTTAIMNKTLGEAEGKTKSLASRLPSLSTVAKGAAVALAAIVAVKLIEYFANVVEEQRKFRVATEGLTNALDSYSSSATAAKGASGTAEGAISSLSTASQTAGEKVKSLIEKQAELAQSLTDTWRDTQTNVTLVDEYQSKIFELAGKCDGSSEKLTELKTAVDLYNEATGSSISITDDVTGALDTELSTLALNTAAWRENAEAQALQEMMVELSKQRIEAEQTEADALANLQAAQSELAEADGENIEIQGQLIEKVNAANAEYEKAKGLTDSCREAEEQLAQRNVETSASYETFKAALASASETLGITESDVVSLANTMGIQSQQGITDFATNISNGMPQTQAAVLAVTGMTETEFNDAMQKMGKSGEDGISDFETAIKNGTNPTVAAAMTVTGLTKEQFDSAASQMGYDGESGVSDFAAKVLAGQPSAVNAANSVRNGTVAEVDAAVPEFETAGTDAGGGFAAKVDEQAGNASTAGDNVGSSSVSGMDSGSSGAGDSGDNAGRSFNDSLGSWCSNVWETASRIGSAAVDALNNALNINSPSKEAIASAKGFAKEGFIDTMAKYTDSAYNTAKKIGEYTTDGLNDGLDAENSLSQFEDGMLAMSEAADKANVEIFSIGEAAEEAMRMTDDLLGSVLSVGEAADKSREAMLAMRDAAQDATYKTAELYAASVAPASSSNKNVYNFAAGSIVVKAKDVTEAKDAASVMDVLLKAKSLGQQTNQ